MKESASRLAFVRDGLSRYPGAREAVNYFQTCIHDAILSVFEAKSNWRNFEPRRVDGSLENSKAMGSVFLHAYIAGTLPNRANVKEKVWLSLGLYWNPPLRKSSSVVAASHCWIDGKGIWVEFNRPTVHGDVKLGSLYRKGERRLVLEPDSDFDPEVSFALLLEAADDGLGELHSTEDRAADPR